MSLLPDPRSYSARGAPDRLLELTRASLNTGDPIARAVHNDALIGELRSRYEAHTDDSILAALAAATSAAEYACLAQRAAEATEPLLAAGEIGARLFALPLIIVAGGRSGAQLAGALPDIDAVSALLSEHAALGDVQRFSLGNALCGVERLDTLDPGMLARAQLDDLTKLAAHFEPDPVLLEGADESVHLRYLVGVAWVSSQAKQWVAAASHASAPAGKWATPLTHLLARHLAQPEVTVLPLARQPLPVALAAAAGRAALADLGFQLFIGGALRRARASIGEPTLIVAAHRLDDVSTHRLGELRITVSSAFDESMCDVYRWPLGPADDLASITTAITALLRECRVDDVVLVPDVQPDRHPARPHERLLLTVSHLTQATPAAQVDAGRAH